MCREAAPPKMFLESGGPAEWGQLQNFLIFCTFSDGINIGHNLAISMVDIMANTIMALFVNMDMVIS